MDTRAYLDTSPHPRRWLLGQASRQDAQRALTDTLLHLLLETIGCLP